MAGLSRWSAAQRGEGGGGRRKIAKCGSCCVTGGLIAGELRVGGLIAEELSVDDDITLEHDRV